MWNFKEGGKVLKNKIIGQKSKYLAPTHLQLPLRQWGAGNVLPLSVVQLKGKHCQKPHCRNGVEDTFGHPLL